MLVNLGRAIDNLLKNNGHSREEIVCVLWGDDDIGNEPDTALSIDVQSFWKYADATEWDNDVWVSGPHYPMWLLSGGEWWIEATEYDCRTGIRFMSKPKEKQARIGINERGCFSQLEEK